MQYIKSYLIGCLVSSMFFLFFFFFYGTLIDGDFEILSLPFIFAFTFPIYMLIANPITVLVRNLLKRSMRYYLPFLIFIMTIVSYLFNFLTTEAQMIGGISGKDYIHIIVFCLITAIPSVLGVEYYKRNYNI